jgi:aspartyl aminopeptidase
MIVDREARAQARALLDFVDASPSPWHAVAEGIRLLDAAGFTPLDEADRWRLAPGGRHYVVRGGGSIIAFVVGREAYGEAGLRLVGAHTDSPGFRVKPLAAHASEGMTRIGVEIYGGPILATFTDRDLSLAGRVGLRTPSGRSIRLVRFEHPLVRLPNLAIHMNRDVNEQGLKLNKQTELPLLLARADGDPLTAFKRPLADALQVDPSDLLTWELAVYDTHAGAFWGADGEFLAAGRLDNLASCHAALSALVGVDEPRATCLVALFDHEEVGSGSDVGAGGSFVSDTVARIAALRGADGEDAKRAMARSFFVSADMAHGWHPNFPSAYEPQHRVLVNSGPVVKINANQRYSTNADTASRFMALCERAGVPCQQYAHRTDLGCGSTIGPIVAAGLGVASVDVGCPMWAMHSVRESAGTLDHGYMIAVLRELYRH